jgi:CMP-N-acetylneuraminic acid synthetase
MTTQCTHIAVIPARAGSVGLPGKNQMFFNKTADFLDELSWIDQVVVSSDDAVVQEKAQSRNYIVHKRSASLSGPDISIKAVFEDLVQSLEIQEDVILWLFYLPILYKNYSDFESAKLIIEQPEIKSLCTFVPAMTHPLTTWQYDAENKKISQYIKNDIYRRQDMPPAWMHYHYVCCFKVSELHNLNNELLNSETHPDFLSEDYAKNLIEVDTPEDLGKWKALNATP